VANGAEKRPRADNAPPFQSSVLIQFSDHPPGSRKSHRASRIPSLCLRCAALDLSAGVAGMDLRLLSAQYLAHDDHQNVDFLFRLPEPRNHYGKFIEYLVPAL
jgi:hypothetical protein